jgi:hypothetical protein
MVAVAPAGAAAAKPKPPLFNIAIRGSEVSVWEQKHDPQSACDATVRGNGSQEVFYNSGKGFRVALVKDLTGSYMVVNPDDKSGLAGFPIDPPAILANADREGTTQTIDAPGGVCNGTGGTVDSRPRDCDEPRYGRLEFRMAYDPANEGDTLKRNYVEVSATLSDFSTSPPVLVPPRNSGEVLSNTFDNCPFWWKTGAFDADHQLLPAPAKLPVKKLLALKKGKKLRVAGDRRLAYAEGDFTGDTLHAWTADVTRVR